MLKSLLKLLSTPKELESAVKEHPGAEVLKEAVAVLLVRMAKVDGLYSKDEVRSLFGTLKSHLKLSDQETIDLMQLAENSTQFADSAKLFAAALRAQLSTEERKKILQMVTEVIRADGKEDEFERMFLASVTADLGLAE